jgi:hypothetical protein
MMSYTAEGVAPLTVFAYEAEGGGRRLRAARLFDRESDASTTTSDGEKVLA